MRFTLREVVFLLGLLAMPCVSYFLIFQPKNDLQDEMRVEIQGKRSKLDALEKATHQYKDLGEEISKMEDAIRVVEEKLPDSRETYVVVDRIADLARSHNLQVELIRPDKTTPIGPYAQELPIQMEIKGVFNRNGFYKFLLEVERMPRVTQIPSMVLRRSEKHGDLEGTLVATMTLSIFFERNDEEVALAK